ncbi:MAG: peptidylprolyl isomerase, partial [Muribaculaceae bacterium]|nr:peptidylprolyl isomerase [Muribaculaceae bacterium]
MTTPTPKAEGPVVELLTTEGPVKVVLYDDTPQHRDNFVKLVTEGYYDGLLFHRVIKDFMVQTGDPDSREARPGQRLGAGSPDYTI